MYPYKLTVIIMSVSAVKGLQWAGPANKFVLLIFIYNSELFAYKYYASSNINKKYRPRLLIRSFIYL